MWCGWQTQFKGEMVYAHIPFASVLGRFFGESKSDNFLSPVTGERGTATNTVRFGTFPKYLWLHLRKYRLTPQWTPEKLDAMIDFPQDLDLSAYKGCVHAPRQPGCCHACAVRLCVCFARADVKGLRAVLVVLQYRAAGWRGGDEGSSGAAANR